MYVCVVSAHNGDLLEWDGEEEEAAMAFGRSDSDAAAVQLHDSLGDHQTQTRARTPLQLARADLDETLEEFGLVVQRDTWPGILHAQEDHTTNLGTVLRLYRI